MKEILGILACLMMVSSVALASPLMDYSAGKASIDLMWSGSHTKATVPGIGSETGSTRYNLDSAITLGLGNSFALQYRSFEPRGTEQVFTDWYIGMKTYEINVLRKLDSGLAVFAGIVPTRFLEGVQFQGGLQDTGLGPTKNYWQVGLVGVQNLGPKMKAFERAAAGSKWTNLEAGLSYPLGSAVEFNVNYRYMKASGLGIAVGGADVTATGFGYGLTYKF